MNLLEIGLSALNASQRALDLAGQNLANANTPGYHRQALVLGPRVLAGGVGQGVEVLKVQRFYETSIERALTDNASRAARLDAELGPARQVEALLTPGTGAAGDRLEGLFNGLAALTARPDDLPSRRSFVNQAAGLAGELNGLARSLGSLQSDLRARAEESVAQVNRAAEALAELNQRIQLVEQSGRPANELRDQRDQVLTDLAGQIDIRVIDQPFGVVNVIAANTALVVGTTAARLEVAADAAGLLSARAEATAVPLSLSQGALAGLIDAHNRLLTEQVPALDGFARALAARLDSAQATGLSLNGPVTQIVGARNVADPAAPLAGVAALPVQAGSLFVSVTDQATGNRVLREVALDPATDSLQDLAAAFTAATGGQVQGSVTADGRLQLDAQASFALDFAGRVPSSPTNVAMGGSASPAVTGTYTGASNGAYTFQVVGSGTVGVTPGLRLEVRDANNVVVRSLNIGQGYTPGTPLAAGDGLVVRLGAGTTSAGSFSVPVTAQADTTGALAALGAGSLFTGSTARDLRVRPEVIDDPRLLAGSRDGQPGDGSNFARLEAARDERLLGGETLVQNLASQTAAAGAAVRTRVDQGEALASLGLSLRTRQQEVSGVDPNEEALNLLQAQRSFQAAARYISAVNTALDEVLNLVR